VALFCEPPPPPPTSSTSTQPACSNEGEGVNVPDALKV
jgi:hypothetical protein